MLGGFIVLLTAAKTREASKRNEQYEQLLHFQNLLREMELYAALFAVFLVALGRAFCAASQKYLYECVGKIRSALPLGRRNREKSR